LNAFLIIKYIKKIRVMRQSPGLQVEMCPHAPTCLQ